MSRGATADDLSDEAGADRKGPHRISAPDRSNRHPLEQLGNYLFDSDGEPIMLAGSVVDQLLCQEA